MDEITMDGDEATTPEMPATDMPAEPNTDESAAA